MEPIAAGAGIQIVLFARAVKNSLKVALEQRKSEHEALLFELLM